MDKDLNASSVLYEEDPNMVLKSVNEKDGPKPKLAHKGLSTFEAALALLSTIVGGGIVGIPYAIYHCGIPLGIFLNISLVLTTYYSFVLYLGAKNQIPVQVESLYEIGFVAVGRSSIFFISVIQLISSFGLMLIYFITFGDTFASIT
jgi:amino acid permease